ncbi:hypothetical protein Tco_0996906, partial [Tanacetum coccineum]
TIRSNSEVRGNALVLELCVGVVQNCCMYMTGTFSVKEIGLYNLYCLNFETSLKNEFAMFEFEAIRWLFFVILNLLSLGSGCSSDTIAACGFARNMFNSENKTQRVISFT